MKDSAARRALERSAFYFTSDDFSRQVKNTDDPLFWLRIEGAIGADITVSDLKRSRQDRETVAGVLVSALSDLVDVSQETTLVFSDIAPASGETERQAETSEVAATIVLVAEAFAMQVTTADTRIRNGKTDLIVRLLPALRS